MSIELEADLIGEESHEVPKLDPDEYCNAKKTITIHFQKWDESTQYIDSDVLEAIKEKNDLESRMGNQETRTYFKGYCQAQAGKGTDHFGEGRCTHHGGETETPGAPASNQNAAKHQITADPHHYTENLSPEREQAIQQDTDVILDRIRKNHGREPDALDVKLARRVAIKLDMVAKASKYVEDVSGLVQVITREGGSHEEKAALLEEIRRFDNAIIGNLKDLGVLEDPKSKEVNEMGEWRKFLEGGDGDGMDAAETEDEDVIDVDSTEVTDSD